MTLDEEFARACLTRGGRKTTPDEVARFLEEAKAGIPIMPVTFFCAFLRKWSELASAPVALERHAGENAARAELGRAACHVFLEIEKSNLLYRLIYAGDPLRTKPCPVHKGRWSGCALPEETECKGLCMFGLNVTGWIAEPEPAGPA